MKRFKSIPSSLIYPYPHFCRRNAHQTKKHELYVILKRFFVRVNIRRKYQAGECSHLLRNKHPELSWRNSCLCWSINIQRSINVKYSVYGIDVVVHMSFRGSSKQNQTNQDDYRIITFNYFSAWELKMRRQNEGGQWGAQANQNSEDSEWVRKIEVRMGEDSGDSKYSFGILMWT